MSSEVSWGEVPHPTAAQLVAGVQPFLFEEVERVGVSPVRTCEGGAMFVGLTEKAVKIRVKGGIFAVARQVDYPAGFLFIFCFREMVHV